MLSDTQWMISLIGTSLVLVGLFVLIGKTRSWKEAIEVMAITIVVIIIGALVLVNWYSMMVAPLMEERWH